MKIHRSLIVKLEQIISYVEKGHAALACHLLVDFITEVNGLMSGGVLDPTEGQPLIEGAESLREVLMC